MTIRKFFITFVLTVCCTALSAQDIKVKMMEALPNDLAARTHPRPDANGVNCALIRVVVPAVKDMKFDGWVVGDCAYQPGEYQVYVPEGAKKIKFRHENYAPGEIVFTMPIESQCVYKVVLDIPDLGVIYVTQSSAMLAEGSRLFAIRKYAEAKQSYEGALAAKDVVEDLIPTIQSNIAQCDTCILYERYTLGALSKIKQIRNTGGSQEELAKFVFAGIDFLQVLNRNNPNEFYSSRILKLEEIIKNQPLEISFTVVRWVNDTGSFFEAGKIPNVQIWAFNGESVPEVKRYNTLKKFRTMVEKSNEFSLVGVTDAQGQVDIQLNRNNMPKGLFFVPVDGEDKIKTEYEDMNDLQFQSKGTYNKRRFRMKMYASY